MQTVILCGGLGTRLREETEFRPKPMINIGDRPILWHIMKLYAYYGFSDFVLCLGYKGDQIRDYFYHYEVMNNDVTLELGHPDRTTIHQSHDELGWKVTLAETGEKALKGARLKRIEKYIKNDVFMMTYGDGVANIDLSKVLEFHLNHGKIATVTGVFAASRFGELKLAGDLVLKFFEKPQSGTDLVNGGFFVFNKAVFDYFTDDDSCDLEYGPLEQIVSEGQLKVYKHDGAWACMDTIRDTDYLNRLWSENKAFWKVW
ncbi:MAG: glucose-1-phosphate cytidylyltransferase [Halobacteriota archaeon]